MIPSSFVQELLARTDIVSVVGRHVELKKAGVNHKGLCPFHGEKSPSFIVSPSRQTYHCFGCGVHGNAIGFLMEHVGLGFVEAVHDLAAEIGLRVPEDDRNPEDRERARAVKQREATLSDALQRAADHWRRTLKRSERAIRYLKGRGLSGEIAARFRIGYAEPSWRGLASAFPRYDDPLLEEAGLVVVQESRQEPDGSSETRRYDRFRDRVMFPIRNVQGQVIGFGGRVLDGGEPKYLNSPETPVFVKGRELYGLYEARQAVRERGCALVVEGYMDVVALAQLGFPNAVATLGTACTADHVAKLFRFTDSVVFSFDGDAAGRRAAARALEAALPHATDTRSIRFLFLPPDHDPDSFVRENGSHAFEQLVDAAVPLSRQIIQQASAGCDLETAEGRTKMLAAAGPLMALLPAEGLLRLQLLKDFAAAGEISAELLESRWSRDAPGTSRSSLARRSLTPARTGSGLVSPRRARPAVATLLDRAVWLVMRESSLWLQLGPEQHEMLTSAPPPHGELFGWIDRHLYDHGAANPNALMDALRAEGAADAIRLLAERIASFHEVATPTDVRRDLDAVMQRLHLQSVEDEIAMLLESGQLSESATARRDELLALRARLKSGRPTPETTP